MSCGEGIGNRESSSHLVGSVGGGLGLFFAVMVEASVVVSMSSVASEEAVALVNPSDDAVIGQTMVHLD